MEDTIESISLQKDTFGGTKNGLSYGSNTFLHLRRVDNLSTVDKLAGPSVSFRQRFHCIQ